MKNYVINIFINIISTKGKTFCLITKSKFPGEATDSGFVSKQNRILDTTKLIQRFQDVQESGLTYVLLHQLFKMSNVLLLPLKATKWQVISTT